MTGTIHIGEDVYNVSFDAYFPIFYRDIMGSDFFEDEVKTNSGDVYKAIDIVYASLRYANVEFDKSLEEWLKEYDIETLKNGVLQGMGILRSTYAMRSNSKKK